MRRLRQRRPARGRGGLSFVQDATTAPTEQLARVLAQRDDSELALLFGSTARSTATPDPDIDLAVRAPGGALLELAAALHEATGHELDIVSLEDPGIPLLEELIRDAVVVYEWRPGSAASWRTHALATLETDRPWYARMRDAWLRAVAEKGLDW